MKITEVKYKYFKFRLPQYLINSKSVIQFKEVLLLTAEDEQNKLHYGEISPLNGFSFETIYDCMEELDKLIDREVIIGNEENILNEINNIEIYPSVKFGIEQILLSLKVKYEPGPLENKILTFPVIINGLIGMNDLSETIKNAEDYLNNNFTTIKIKIGRDNFAQDLEIVEKIKNRFGEKLNLRLDVNGKWAFDEAIYNIKKLQKNNIQFIEQPVSNYNDMLKLADEFGPIIVPDEIITSYEDAVATINSNKFKYIVLKPSIRIGVFDSIKIIELANSRKIKTIITSAYETIVGRNTLLFLASITDHNLAHGLNTELLGNEVIESKIDFRQPKISLILKNYFNTFKIIE